MILSNSLILKKDERWFIIPCFGNENEIIRSIVVENDGQDSDAVDNLDGKDLLALVRSLGWDVRVYANFAA